MSDKNVIIIVVDALRAKNLSCYGYGKPTCPNFEKIAGEGVLFEDAYSCTDQTDVSFTTIMSGKYPLSHGILHHGEEVTPEEVANFRKTGTALLSEMLQKNGYATIGMDWLGRWHKKGFEIYGEPEDLFSYTPHGSFFLKHPLLRAGLERVYIRLPCGLYRGLHGFLKRKGFFCGRNVESYTDVGWHVIKHIKETGRPFFLLMHLWDVHTPLCDVPRCYLSEFYNGEKIEPVRSMAERIPDEKWRKKTLVYHLKGVKDVAEVIPRYDASIRYADDFIGRFVSRLQKEGILKDTYFIITADHGDNLMRDGVFIGHGGLYQSVIKVPFILRGPEIPSNRRIRGFVQHVDIVPTILELLGMRVPDVDGKSLLGLIDDGTPVRDYAFSVSSTARRRYSLVTERYKYIYSPTKEDAMDKYGGIWFRDTKELYDLKEDPEEKENLYKQMPDVAGELESRLLSIVRALSVKRERAILKNKLRTIT